MAICLETKRVMLAAGSTCCCQREFFGYCFTWACCPLDNAVCCDDLVHCCPHDLPVCDTTIGRCLKKDGESILESTEWYSKTPAMKVSPLPAQRKILLSFLVDMHF